MILLTALVSVAQSPGAANTFSVRVYLSIFGSLLALPVLSYCCIERWELQRRPPGPTLTPSLELTTNTATTSHNSNHNSYDNNATTTNGEITSDSAVSGTTLESTSSESNLLVSGDESHSTHNIDNSLNNNMLSESEVMIAKNASLDKIPLTFTSTLQVEMELSKSKQRRLFSSSYIYNPLQVDDHHTDNNSHNNGNNNTTRPRYQDNNNSRSGSGAEPMAAGEWRHVVPASVLASRPWLTRALPYMLTGD
jgi:hypothetical protein